MRSPVACVLSAILAIGTLAAPGLAIAAEPQGSPDSWAYLDSTQSRWNPCKAITFKVNETAQPGTASDTRDALWRAGQASGLVFEFQGLTDFVPTRAQSVPAGTDLVVAVVRKNQTDAWNGQTGLAYTSVGRVNSFKSDGSKAVQITKGYILLDAASALPPGFESNSRASTRGELLMHEGGHAVGLGHVNDETQRMNPIVFGKQGQWGAGDLSGLAAIGSRNGCLYPTAGEASANQGSVPPQPSGPFAGPTEPSPTASPSPTDGPSASPSPSSAPSTTPSASPSSSAKPVTLTITPSAISAGETTTVSYFGTPGAVVDILSRTQPSSVFTKIGTITLDGNGRGSSTHKPQKSTRITARAADGTMSDTAPIIAVRSVASINASRESTRTFTFSGRVYPALQNRLVNLYRNGTLVAQGRSDASGIYRMTKTLAAGTFVFQIRTSNDQNNLGTNSRESKLLIN